MGLILMRMLKVCIRILTQIGLNEMLWNETRISSLSTQQPPRYALEYGINRTRWLIILILCRLGCRLKST
jgi:hypothetical protein